MTPKTPDARLAQVLVEIPIDVAERAIAAARAGLHDASGDEIDALIGVPDTPIGDRVRPDAAGWAGRH